ncbi:MAG TPA: M28 family peptidase [Actinomycetes bacterium]|nr:M28 family peptidase [Actinomycetes bacterium]
MCSCPTGGSTSACGAADFTGLGGDPRQPRNKLRFIWFGAEEPGLLGSEHCVGSLSEAAKHDIIGAGVGQRPDGVRRAIRLQPAHRRGDPRPAGCSAGRRPPRRGRSSTGTAAWWERSWTPATTPPATRSRALARRWCHASGPGACVA